MVMVMYWLEHATSIWMFVGSNQGATICMTFLGDISKFLSTDTLKNSVGDQHFVNIL